MMNHKTALSQYKTVNTHAVVESASPHRLVQMLMEGALQRMAEAKGAIQRQSTAEKGEALGKAISIIGGLRDALNKGVDSDLPDKLDSLYVYMSQRLSEANRDNAIELIDEAIELMKTLKEGWDGIAEESHN